MGAPGRVELPTNGLGNRCSIHLSYGASAGLKHYLTWNREAGEQDALNIYAQPLYMPQVKIPNKGNTT